MVVVAETGLVDVDLGAGVIPVRGYPLRWEGILPRLLTRLARFLLPL